MTVRLADIGKIHFFRRRRLADKYFGDGGGLELYLRCLQRSPAAVSPIRSHMVSSAVSCGFQADPQWGS